MRQLDVRQRPLVGRAHVGVDHLFARRLVHRQRSGSLQVTDHLRGAGPLAQQLHKLAVQNINLVLAILPASFHPRVASGGRLFLDAGSPGCIGTRVESIQAA